ncbi:MAG TPA: lytic transglycosylase domain-containing protein [Thermoanaerobaculia bacterium]|nr:lytic transglycosylase domain-containing protein [Thermoanaerobaculia bacterium]
MRWKTLVALGILSLLAAPGSAKVRIVVQNGKKVIFNDGVGEKRPAGARRTNDQWLASRISRPSAYDNLITNAAENHSLDPRLVKSVMLVESGFNASAVSNKGARGLMQLMPATAERHGVKNVHDPAQNIAGGTKYLSHLLELFDGNLEKSLAAYNAGEGAVARYGGIPPYDETRDYVRKALTAYYGAPYKGGAAGSLGGGFGKPVRIERDAKNRPVLTTARPTRPLLRSTS